MQSSTVLAYLKNGDIVFDLGERQSGDVQSGSQETWVKVQTQDGIIGWTRERFLEVVEDAVS